MFSDRPGSRGTALLGALGAGLLLAGLLCLGLWRVLSGTENLSFTDGAAAPPPAHVTEGETYSLAVPGGVRAMIAHGVYGAPAGQLSLSCDWSIGASLPQSLSVTPENTETKAETTVARFDAPVTGSLRVTCANWGAVFVPDADNVAADTSGWLLLLSVVTLTAGVAFALSAARQVSLRSSRRGGADEEVERFVDLGQLPGYDGEVRYGDGSDVPP